jgi:hypothetical protein
MSSDNQQYWADIITLVGEIPPEKVAAKIMRDHPDLIDRAKLAALAAFNVKAGLQTADALEDDEPNQAHLERVKMMDLLDVIFFMLGGQVETSEREGGQ